MTLQRLLKWGTLTSGVVCLAAGYSLIGQWVLLAVVGLVWLAGVWVAGWSSMVFVALVGLAMVGIGVGASPLLMITGATSALASWDLANWENFTAGGLPAETTARIERKHYTHLVLALGSGLLVSIIGRGINFHLPFGILMLLVVLLLLGMNQMWRLLNR